MSDKNKNKNFIGIDPGVHGAIAFLNHAGQPQTMPLPYLKSKKGLTPDWRGTREVVHKVCLKAGIGSSVYLEDPTHGKTNNRAGIAKLYQSTGFLHGLVLGFGLDLSCALVTPGAWKRSIPSKYKNYGHLSGSARQRAIKRASVALANDLYPELKFKVKQDGEAEALLIAHWGKYRSFK